jgi:alpha-L-fucosidase
MKINGDSIYGTTASPFPNQLTFGRATSKVGRIYLHVFNWPADGKLKLPSWGKEVQKAYLLSRPKDALKVNTTGNTIVIQTPMNAPDPIASVIVLETSR